MTNYIARIYSLVLLLWCLSQWQEVKSKRTKGLARDWPKNWEKYPYLAMVYHDDEPQTFMGVAVDDNTIVINPFDLKCRGPIYLSKLHVEVFGDSNRKHKVEKVVVRENYRCNLYSTDLSNVHNHIGVIKTTKPMNLSPNATIEIDQRPKLGKNGTVFSDHEGEIFSLSAYLKDYCRDSKLICIKPRGRITCFLNERRPKNFFLSDVNKFVGIFVGWDQPMPLTLDDCLNYHQEILRVSNYMDLVEGKNTKR